MGFTIVAEWTAVTFMYLTCTTLAEFCSYQTQNGSQWVECPESCCKGYSRKYSTSKVCCGNKYDGAYIGGGMAALVCVSVVVLCYAYNCCKTRISRTDRRQHTQSRLHTSVHPSSNDVITSIRRNIEPTLPPPYSLLPSPPPYYPIDCQTGSSQKSSNTLSHPDHPPPGYTEI